jgi:serpin B
MTTNRRELLALSGALFAALAGCLGDEGDTGNGPDPAIGQSEPNGDPDDLEFLIESNTKFAFDLLETAVATEPSENLFVSPLSISIALSMTWAGARGDTEDAMAETLGFELDQSDLHPAFNTLTRTLHERSEPDDGGGGMDEGSEGGEPFELAIANALWANEGHSFREGFLDTVRDHYGAGVEEMDFAEALEESREEINGWIEDRTENRIEDLLPAGSIDPSTVLVLTNAIYFLAGWHHSFDESDTTNAEFTALDGSTEEVSLMSQTERFPYTETDEYRAIELPYVGEATSMVVVLPEEFEEVEKSLDADRLAEIFDGFEEIEGTISLPRFEIESSFELADVLGELGMEVAFTGGADFSGMIEGGGIWIDEVYHDTFVAVDEEGTEAAAATAVAMEDSEPLEVFEMRVDRPFLFLIRDRETDSVLFLGRVVEAPDDP